jgi:hypothetical protein
LPQLPEEVDFHEVKLANGHSPVVLTLPISPSPETASASLQIQFGEEGRSRFGTLNITTLSHAKNALAHLGHGIMEKIGRADLGYRADEDLHSSLVAVLGATRSTDRIHVNPLHLVPAPLREKYFIASDQNAINQPEEPFTNYRVRSQSPGKQIEITRSTAGANEQATDEQQGLKVTIAIRNKVDTKVLDGIAKTAFDLEWGNLRIGAGTDSRKILIHNGTVGIAIPVFHAHAKDPIRVERHEVVFLLQDQNLIVVDGTPNGTANKWLEVARNSAISSEMLSSPAALLCSLMEQCVNNNERVLNHFDQIVKHLQEEAEKKPLSKARLTQLRTIQEALGYMCRKTEETESNV